MASPIGPILSLLLFAIPCLSHKRLWYPPPRDNQTASRDAAPCGGVSFEEAAANGLTTEWRAGQKVEIIVLQEIYHAQEPMRLAISGENDEDFESCIWLNHIPQHTRGGNERNLVIELTVPDMQCTNCTLQLIGFQTGGNDESSCCLYTPDCSDQFDDEICCGDTQYFSCSNIDIKGGSRSRNDVCTQPNSWGFRDFKCNYFMAEESESAWEVDGDGTTLNLITSGSFDDLDPTAEEHCGSTDFEVAVSTECQATVSALSDDMLSLFQGGEMRGDGVFAIIVVLVLVASIVGTYCLTKNKNGTGDAEPVQDTVTPQESGDTQ